MVEVPNTFLCFRSFIKSTNVLRMGNFVENFNFVSTSWKIIIPLGNSVQDHICVIQIHILCPSLNRKIFPDVEISSKN